MLQGHTLLEWVEWVSTLKLSNVCSGNQLGHACCIDPKTAGS